MAFQKCKADLDVHLESALEVLFPFAQVALWMTPYSMITLKESFFPCILISLEGQRLITNLVSAVLLC